MLKRFALPYGWFLALVTLTLMCGAVLYSISRGIRDGRGHRSCTSNLMQIGRAFQQYSQDYDDRLPLINVHAVAESREPFPKPYGWADVLYPYCKSVRTFQCPSQVNLPDGALEAAASQFTDYYYNSNLTGIDGSKLPRPDITILLGEGNDGTDGTDARYNRNVLPKAWHSKSDSPAQRHIGGGNYAFVDGHVKWLKPEQAKAIRVTKSDYSFALR